MEIFWGFLLINIIIKDKIYIVVGRILRFWKPSDGLQQENKEKRNAVMTLRDLPVGKTATIRSVGGEGALRQHFLDMGLIPQGEVTVVK